MTTIAYKDRVIAYDSLITQGDTIVDNDYCKSSIKDGVSFFLAGQSHLMDDIINMYFDNEFKEMTSNVNAFAHDRKTGNLYLIGAGPNDHFWKFKMNKERHTAIGSGSDHALTAMDMGATAEKAVEMAMKRDVMTGGRIRLYRA